MTTRQNIQYKVHVPIICILLIAQFFAQDIFASIFLPIAEKKYRQKPDAGKFYLSGECKRQSTEVPYDYAFVVVRHAGQLTIEAYFTKKANYVEVTYLNGQWQSTREIAYANIAYLFLPSVGLILCLFAIIHKMARTKSVAVFAFHKYPLDIREKILCLYGVPLFISGILLAWLGLA